jgi:multiple sugar transport system permease protein
VKSRTRVIVLALLPALLVICMVAVVPIIFQFYTSLHSFRLGYPWESRDFLGFDNYARLFARPTFRYSFWITVQFAFGVTFASLVVGLTFALLLNRTFRFKSIVVSSVLIPVTISPGVIGLIWRLMLNTEFGVVNYFLRPFGMDANWLGRDLAFTSILLVSTWFASSFMTLVCLAGLESLPSEPFEAAVVDGANVLQRFFYITLPLLQPVLFVAILLQQVATLHVFGIIFVLTGGGPGNRTNVLALEVYRQGLNSGNMGMAAAVAGVLALLALGLSSLLISRFRRGLH